LRLAFFLRMCLCSVISALLFFSLPHPRFFSRLVATRTVDRANEGAARIGKETFVPFFVRCTIPGGGERGKEAESAKIAEHENRGGNAENRLGRLQSRCRWEKLLWTIRERFLPLSLSLSLSLSLFPSTTKRQPDCCKNTRIKINRTIYLTVCLFATLPENIFTSLELHKYTAQSNINIIDFARDPAPPPISYHPLHRVRVVIDTRCTHQQNALTRPISALRTQFARTLESEAKL